MSEQDHVGLWNRCLEIIRDNVPEQTYKTWFLPIIPLKYEDKTLVVQVPSQFFYEFLEDKFVDLLRKTLYKVIGEGTKLMYNVMVDKSSRPEKTVNYESTHRTIIPQKPTIDKAIPQIPVPDLDPHLNPEYNFDTFIEGYSNKLSRSVAEAVALNPAKTIFNPLFLYGAQNDVKRLRRRNGNASVNSAHCFGATFDVSWKRFKKVEDEDGRPLQDVSADTLKLVLSEVLRDLRKAEKCYIKYELKQGCFHITAR